MELEGIVEQKEETAESFPKGKDFLIYLLQKTFDSKILNLEKTSTEHFDSLANTSKAFNEFNITLNKLVHEAQKPKFSIEIDNSNNIESKKPSQTMSRSKTTANLIDMVSGKKQLKTGQNNATLQPSKTKQNLRTKNLSSSTLLKSVKGTTKSSGKLSNVKGINKGSKTVRDFKSGKIDPNEAKKKLNQSAYVSSRNRRLLTAGNLTSNTKGGAKKMNIKINEKGMTSSKLTTSKTIKDFKTGMVNTADKKQFNQSAYITKNQNQKKLTTGNLQINIPGEVTSFNITERSFHTQLQTESNSGNFENKKKLNQSAYLGGLRRQQTAGNLLRRGNNKGKKVKDLIKTTNLKNKNDSNKSQATKKSLIPDKFFEENKNETWLDNIMTFLNIKDQLTFTTTSKVFKKHYLLLITSFEESINSALNLEEGESIEDRIETLETKAQEREDQAKLTEFNISKGSIRAIELFNGESYNKLFKIVLLDPQMKEIIVIYRILFRFLNEEKIATIENDNKFWTKCCEFLHQKGGDNNIGNYLLSAANNFNFEDRNIFLISKLIAKKQVILVPSYYSKICATTGLIMFLIKDSLEYCGIIYSEKRTPNNRMLNNAIYAKTLLERIKKIKVAATKF